MLLAHPGEPGIGLTLGPDVFDMPKYTPFARKKADGAAMSNLGEALEGEKRQMCEHVSASQSRREMRPPDDLGVAR